MDSWVCKSPCKSAEIERDRGRPTRPRDESYLPGDLSGCASLRNCGADRAYLRHGNLDQRVRLAVLVGAFRLGRLRCRLFRHGLHLAYAAGPMS